MSCFPQTLLDRGINVAARDIDGCTARDYLTMYDGEHNDKLRMIIDDFIIDQVCNDQVR